jgi:hypothetical protein
MWIGRPGRRTASTRPHERLGVMMGAMLRAGFGPSVVRLTVVAVLSAVACANEQEPPPDRATVERTIVLHDPTALVAEPSGDLLVAERTLGRIRRVSAHGVLDTEPVATVDVADEGQRGLVGLAENDAGEIYASWTRASDGRLVVGRVAPGRTRLIWVGPVSADLANGGTLRLRGDRLIVAVGDLQEPESTDDPDAPNGKLLSLDPGGPPDQDPDVLSSGWNNPYAMTVLGNGEIWVADNAPGRDPERLGRGDGTGTGTGDRAGRTGELPGHRAPSALVELPDDRLAVCGYLTDDLRIVEPRPDGDRLRVEIGPVVVDRCRTSAVVLGPRLLAVATDTAVLVVSLAR